MWGAYLVGALNRPGDHGRLGERQVAHRLPEVELGGRLDAEGAAAEIGAIEIEAEDLALRQVGLEPQGEERLVDLARQSPLVGEKQVLGKLLGQ